MKSRLELLALGYTKQQIADKLSLSINTVKSQLKVSYAKLGMSNRAQANIVFSQLDFSKDDGE